MAPPTGKLYTVVLELTVEHVTGEELAWDQVADGCADHIRQRTISALVRLPRERLRIGGVKVRTVTIKELR